MKSLCLSLPLHGREEGSTYVFVVHRQGRILVSWGSREDES